MNANDYKLARKSSLLHLEIEVRRLIAEGWQPIGGPMATHDAWYVQAMVKTYMREWAGPM